MSMFHVASYSTSCQKCGIDTDGTIKVERCIKCNVHFCDTCQQQHILENRHHLFPSVIIVADRDDHISQYACLRHRNNMIEYICGTHKSLLCFDCINRHKTCYKIEEIKEASKGVKTSTDLRALLSDIRASIETCDALIVNNKYNLSRIDRGCLSITDDINDSITDIKRTIAKMKHSQFSHKPRRNTAHDKTKSVHIDVESQEDEDFFKLQKLIDCRAQYLTGSLNGMKHCFLSRLINKEEMQAENVSEFISEIEQLKNSFFLYRKSLQKLLRVKKSEREVFIEMMITKINYFSCKMGLFELSDAWQLVTFDGHITHNAISQHIVVVTFYFMVERMPNHLLISRSQVEQKKTQNPRSRSTSSAKAMISFVNRMSSGTTIGGLSFKMEYVLIDSFRVKRSRHVYSIGKCFIKCILVLQNGKIVLADNNACRLLVYEKWGYLVREIELSGNPHSFSEVNNKKLAVTIPAKEKVIFVNAKDYRIRKNEEILFEDYCFGITCVNNKLVVNCENKGIFVCSLNGTIEKNFPWITGRLCMCAGKSGTVFSTKQFSNTIVKTDIFTGIRYHYRFAISRPCGGIVSDIAGENVYVACNGSHEIVKCNFKTGKMAVLLNLKDHNIVFPSSVYIDEQTSELIISNIKSMDLNVYQLEYI